MDPVKLVNDFVEGRLDSSQEDQLFMMLQSSDELRQELKQTIAIDKALHRKLSSYMPSTAATMGVFSQLGFEIPSEITSSGKSAPKAGFFGKPGSIFLSALGAGILVAALFLLFIMPSAVESGIAEAINKKEAEYAALLINTNIAVVSSYEKETYQIDNDTRNQTGTSKAPSAAKKSSQNQSTSKPVFAKRLAYAEDGKDNQITDIDENNQASDENNYSGRGGNLYDSELTLSIVEDHDFIDIPGSTKGSHSLYTGDYLRGKRDLLLSGMNPNEYIGLSFLVSGAQFWTSKEAYDIYSIVPKFYNMSFGAYYKISDNFSAGIEARQEKFFQEFEGTDEAGLEFRYRQNPNYITLTAAGKYYFYRDDLFKPYVMLSGGWAATGAVGRTGIGIEIAPSQAYSFVIGAEGSALVYSHQNEFYFSPKWGVSYGVLFNF